METLTPGRGYDVRASYRGPVFVRTPHTPVRIRTLRTNSYFVQDKAMAKSKMLFCGEWVKVRPFFNKQFKASGHCSLCRGMSCSPGWHSIKTGEFRCAKCFKAEGGFDRHRLAGQTGAIPAR